MLISKFQVFSINTDLTSLVASFMSISLKFLRFVVQSSDA